MSTPLNYQIRLAPNILSRAKIILGSLLILTVILLIAGTYQGVQSGDFDKALVKPFREFGANLDKTINETPVPIPTPNITLAPVSTSTTSSTSTSTTKVIINQTTPVIQNCIKMNIREGEFASNKCYSQTDYEDLQYYLGRYSSAKLDLSAAEGFLKIDCGAAQTFEVKKADCTKDQQDRTAAEAELSKYRGIIQGIIAKGR